jgi:GxxExxY protein
VWPEWLAAEQVRCWGLCSPGGYEEALVWELRESGVTVEQQVPLPLCYKGKQLSSPLRQDLIVGSKLIVECKPVAQYNTVLEPQTMTYLRLSGLKL